MAPPPPETIGNRIDQQDTDAEGELDLASEAGGIERGGDVVLDEAASVACFTALPPQPDFQGRQRTDEAKEFDRRAVERDWDMNVRKTPPTQREESAQDDEEDEQEMNGEHAVGEDAKPHDYKNDTGRRGLTRRNLFPCTLSPALGPFRAARDLPSAG